VIKTTGISHLKVIKTTGISHLKVIKTTGISHLKVIKILLWETDILQLLITAAYMKRRCSGIRLCDEAIMFISAIRVSLCMCGMH